MHPRVFKNADRAPWTLNAALTKEKSKSPKVTQWKKEKANSTLRQNQPTEKDNPQINT